MAVDDMAFEEILESVEGNGRYQQGLFWFFLVPLHFMIPFAKLVPIFQTTLPDHWCHTPGIPSNISEEQWKNMTIPWVEKEGHLSLSSCLQFSEVKSSTEGFVADDSSPDVEACLNGWDYDHTWYDRTLSMDNDWVCDKDSYGARWLSVEMPGHVVGTLVFSYLSDYWGRKPMVLVTTQIYLVFSIVRLYVTSEWALMLMMFCSALAFPAMLSMSWILVVEQVSSGIRARITSTSFIMWTTGMSLLPLLAWLTRSWVKLGLATSIPYVLFLLVWLLPESPRWLILKGRQDDSLRIMERMADINGVSSPTDLRKSLELYAQSQKSSEKITYLTVFELFKYPTLRLRVFLLTFTFLANVVVYYGILYGSVNLSGNKFLNFFLLSVTEFPANIIGWWAAQTFGRRRSQSGFLTVSALWIFAAIFVPSSMPWVETGFLVASKTLVTTSFLIIYIQMAELYPTSHRSTGTGIACVCSNIVGIAIPYVAYSGRYWTKLPYIILTIVGVAGGIIAAFIPETLDQNLPQTALEADEFLTDERCWSYRGKRFECKKGDKKCLT